MPMIRLDTNYILRYLLNDNEAMAVQAERVILEQEVFIANEVLAETVYVLDGVYGLEADRIAEVLEALLQPNNIRVNDKYMLLNALRIYAQKRLDFVDCILCAYGRIDTIVTFDKKLQRCVAQQMTI